MQPVSTHFPLNYLYCHPSPTLTFNSLPISHLQLPITPLNSSIIAHLYLCLPLSLQPHILLANQLCISLLSLHYTLVSSTFPPILALLLLLHLLSLQFHSPVVCENVHALIYWVTFIIDTFTQLSAPFKCLFLLFLSLIPLQNWHLLCTRHPFH